VLRYTCILIYLLIESKNIQLFCQLFRKMRHFLKSICWFEKLISLNLLSLRDKERILYIDKVFLGGMLISIIPQRLKYSDYIQ